MSSPHLHNKCCNSCCRLSPDIGNSDERTSLVCPWVPPARTLQHTLLLLFRHVVERNASRRRSFCVHRVRTCYWFKPGQQRYSTANRAPRLLVRTAINMSCSFHSESMVGSHTFRCDLSLSIRRMTRYVARLPKRPREPGGGQKEGRKNQAVAAGSC